MSEMVFCRGCGKEIHKDATSCPNCGAPQRTASSKSRMTAALLAFFLGGLGAHKFYLGKVGKDSFTLFFAGHSFRQSWHLLSFLSIYAHLMKTLPANMANA